MACLFCLVNHNKQSCGVIYFVCFQAKRCTATSATRTSHGLNVMTQARNDPVNMYALKFTGWKKKVKSTSIITKKAACHRAIVVERSA